MMAPRSFRFRYYYQQHVKQVSSSRAHRITTTRLRAVLRARRIPLVLAVVPGAGYLTLRQEGPPAPSLHRLQRTTGVSSRSPRFFASASGMTRAASHTGVPPDITRIPHYTGIPLSLSTSGTGERPTVEPGSKLTCQSAACITLRPINPDNVLHIFLRLRNVVSGYRHYPRKGLYSQAVVHADVAASGLPPLRILCLPAGVWACLSPIVRVALCASLWAS